MQTVTRNIEPPFPHKRFFSYTTAAAQRIGHILPIDHQTIDINTRQIAKSGQQIDRAKRRIIINPPGRNAIGPANNKRRTHATFVKTAFATAKRTGRTNAAMRGIANVNIFGTVVRRKNNDGIITQIQFIEFIHQPANMAVCIGDNRIVNPQRALVLVFQAIRRELFVRLHLLLSGIENGMGIVKPCLNKKRLVFIALNKANGFINNHLCRAATTLASLQIGKIEQRAIPHIDFTLVNAVIIRRGRTLSATEMPLAKVSHGVPALL